jgi:hypothetical protein
MRGRSTIEGIDVYTAKSSTEWAFSAGAGVLMGELNSGAPQQYNVGNALSPAGSTAHISVATGNYQIHYFDSSTRAKLGTIYSRECNKIFNIETGATVRSSATPVIGTGMWNAVVTSEERPPPVITGPCVVYLARASVPASVRLESY